MTNPIAENPLPTVGGFSISVPDTEIEQNAWIPHESRAMGINIFGGKGSGKSFLIGRILALLDILLGLACVFIDPVGNSIDHLLSGISLLSPEMRARIWPRIRYIDVSGHMGSVIPCPFYYRLGNESLYEISQRPLDLIKKLHPHLETASVMGGPAQHRIGTAAGMLLAALGYQITEAEDLLYNPANWRSRWQKAANLYPDELGGVVAFFESYAEMGEREREQKRLSFMQMFSPFMYDPAMRAMFGAERPGIDWQEVIANKQIVLIDFRHVTDLERRRLLMWWWFSYFLSFIKYRGHGRRTPISLYLDELTAFLNHSASNESFVQEIDALLNVYSRSHQIWLTTAMQEAWQVDKHIVKGLMGMGTQYIGRQDPDSAEMIVKYLFRYNPKWVRKYEPVWMAGGFDMLGPLDPYVVDYTSTEFTPQEQTTLNSYHITDLGLFQFLLRLARSEGDVHGGLYQVKVAQLEKVEWVPDWINADTRKRLFLRDSIPIPTILEELRNRQNPAHLGALLRDKQSNKGASADDILADTGEKQHAERTGDLSGDSQGQSYESDFWSEEGEE